MYIAHMIQCLACRIYIKKRLKSRLKKWSHSFLDYISFCRGKWSIWKETCVPIFKDMVRRNMATVIGYNDFHSVIGLKYKGNFWQIQEKIPHFRFPPVAQTLKRTVHCFLSRNCNEGVINSMSCYREKISRKSVGYGEKAEKAKMSCNENRVHIIQRECLRHKSQRNYIIYDMLKEQLRLYEMLWYCQHLEPFDKTTFDRLMHHFFSDLKSMQVFFSWCFLSLHDMSKISGWKDIQTKKIWISLRFNQKDQALVRRIIWYNRLTNGNEHRSSFDQRVARIVKIKRQCTSWKIPGKCRSNSRSKDQINVTFKKEQMYITREKSSTIYRKRDRRSVNRTKELADTIGRTRGKLVLRGDSAFIPLISEFQVHMFQVWIGSRRLT